MFLEILDLIFGGTSSVMISIAPVVLASLISAGSGLVSAGIGASAESRKRREMQRERQKWQNENTAWYNRVYNEDFTKRADVQHVINQMRQEMKNANKRDEGRQAITGATNESVLAQKDNRNRTMGRIFSNLASYNTKRKDQLGREYRQRKYAIQGLNYDTMKEQAQSSNNFMYSGLNALANTDWAGIMSGTTIGSKMKTPKS